MSLATVPTMPQPPQSTTNQASNAPITFSKRELAGLVKGEKINLFAGQPPNATFLFPVPIKLVKHFSPRWKHQLDEENQKVLYVTAHKDPVKLIIEWMLAGGVDSKAKGSIPYPHDNPLKLLCLNKLVAFLKINSLENRTLKRIDNITRNQPLGFEQMIRLFSVASIPSETHHVLQRNLSRWVGALSSDEWKKKCSQASTISEQKTALIILCKLRLAVEENRDKRKSLKSSASRANGQRQTVKKTTTLTENEISGNAAADTRETGSWNSKLNGKAWRQGKRLPATNGDAGPVAKKSTSVVRDTVGAKTEWKIVGKLAVEDVVAMENSKETIAPAENKPRNGRVPMTKHVSALDHDTKKPLK